MLGTSMVRSNSISWQDGEVHIELLEWFQETLGITYQFDPLKKNLMNVKKV